MSASSPFTLEQGKTLPAVPVILLSNRSLADPETRRGVPIVQQQTCREVPIVQQQTRREVPIVQQPDANMARSSNKKIIIGGVIVAIIAIIVGSVMLVKSFSTLHYYEYGFKQQKSTGEVSLDKVYRGGKAWFGPDYDFLIYRADAHFLDLVKIDIFTRDKLEIGMSAHMQYFLREDELPLLHTKFNVYYHDIMINSAEDALKGAIPVFSTRELINNRSEVESVLHKAIRQRLGGSCCRPDCTQYELACPIGCKPHDTCTNEDKGHHVDVEGFTLGKYYIPEPVESRFMEALLLQEKNLQEELKQNASIIRKKTEEQVKMVKNEANEIKQSAAAEAALIRNIAWADYYKTRELARITGLANTLRSLNITDDEKKISFDYMRTLMKQKNIHISVDYDTLIAGKLKERK